MFIVYVLSNMPNAIFGVCYLVYNTKYGIARLFMLNFCDCLHRFVWLVVAHIFLASGLEILSTSYAGAPAEPSLRDEPVGHVRNIRVKITNRYTMPEKYVPPPTKSFSVCLLSLTR